MAGLGLGRRNEMVGGSKKRARKGREVTCPRCAHVLNLWSGPASAGHGRTRVQLVEDEVGHADLTLDAIVNGAQEDAADHDDVAHESSGDSIAQVSEAVAVGILSALEAKILGAVLRMHREGKRSSWRAVGRAAACTHQRARRTFLTALHRWHTSLDRSDRLTWITEEKVTRIQGVRGREVSKWQGLKLGRRRQGVGELVTDRQRRKRVLRASSAAEDRQLRPIRESAMRRLLVALAAHLAQGSAGTTGDTVGRHESEDWPHNLQWAIRKLQRAQLRSKRPAPTTFKEILLELSRGCPSCKNCRTPILIGCRLDGRRRNRGRKSCDESCKMQAHRHPPNTPDK